MKKEHIEQYSRLDLVHHEPAMRLLSSLNLKGDETILDICCGDGKLTAAISLLVPNGSVVGIDISEEIINFATSKFPRSVYSNLDFEIGDAKKMDFYERFDLVVSFGSLHAITEHETILKRIYTSLKQHGRLAIQFAGKAKPNDFQSLIITLLKSEKWKSQLTEEVTYSFYEIEEYREILNLCKLHNAKIDISIGESKYQRKEDFYSYSYDAWLSLSSRIPEDLYASFIDDLVELYIQYNPPDDNNILHVKFICLEVTATKNELFLGK
ncbi:trans-aconitate 2-methyltransferase [Pseudanabaena sp. BC1403]|uniref:class I SAM-dependent methyltransferase n=1 Tax=Pseudanabaena sp. BC1403 TaxID=2043171 RepID=UPI000CD81D9E|nr:class I SAM-dependent methyltransferase [Pseudanabaena sp. BC1403]